MEEKVVPVSTYTKEVTLPSNGLLGGPKTITIRAMSVAEEKILYSTKDSSYLAKLCKVVTINPKNLDLNKILPIDVSFIIFQLRELTFGPVYQQRIRCPYCGLTQDVDIHIDQFEYKLIDPEKLNEELYIDLPISKSRIHLRLLSQEERDFIDKEALNLYKDGKISDPDSYVELKLFSSMIESATGVEFTKSDDRYRYLMSMHAADFNAIQNAIGKLDFGIQNHVTVTCKNKNCEEKVEVQGTICPEFFHPTI